MSDTLATATTKKLEIISVTNLNEASFCFGASLGMCLFWKVQHFAALFNKCNYRSTWDGLQYFNIGHLTWGSSTYFMNAAQGGPVLILCFCNTLPFAYFCYKTMLCFISSTCCTYWYQLILLFKQFRYLEMIKERDMKICGYDLNFFLLLFLWVLSTSESFHFFRVFQILYMLKLQGWDFSDQES